jgi:nucleoside-diphosphate-sugar epimerase
VHAGALHKPDIARYPPQAFVDVSVTGALNLLQAVAAASVDRFVFTTSLMVSQVVRNEDGYSSIRTRSPVRLNRATSTASPSWLRKVCAASSL